MTILLTVVVVLAVEGCAFLLYRRWARPAPLTEDARQAAIDAAVREACARVGLNAEALTDDFDLAPTGKLYEVLRHAGATLGVDPELNTVGDVKKWLAD